MSRDPLDIEEENEVPVVSPLEGKRVAFVGKLGGVNKREAQQLVRQHGGLPVEKASVDVDLVVIGADELPLQDHENFLDDAIREAAAQGRLELLAETQLWQRLGLVEGEQNIRRLYTPAMLAELLKVSVATIRRWHRRKLIVPVREVHRLPYFDFQEVATARRLAELVTAGASPAAIERQLADLSRFVPEVERPLAQLSVIVEGQQLLLRQGEGLVEPGGQRRIDFDSLETPGAAAGHVTQSSATAPDDAHSILSLEKKRVGSTHDDACDTPDEMLRHAAEFEDLGRLDLAAEMYRAALAAGGPKPEICFQLAELLYRVGDISAARERYYMAIEIDEDYVEARANLGCILAETGQTELAVAAFIGALRFHPDYPDVHYHLARAYDELERRDDAAEHWQAFLALAPDSPWADEARIRLGESTT